MPVSDIMTSKLITVSPQLTIGELHPMFKKYGIHHLLVVADHLLIGIVSDRDVLRNISPFVFTSASEKKDEFTLTRKAEQIMTKNLITVTPDTSISEACATLLKNGVSLLPVLDDQQLVGVVSWKDILKYFLH